MICDWPLDVQFIIQFKIMEKEFLLGIFPSGIFISNELMITAI